MNKILVLMFFITAMAAFGHSMPQEGTVSDTQRSEESVGDSLTCFLCIAVMGRLRDTLKDKKLQENLETAIELGLCPLLPITEGKNCQTQVKLYGPIVFQLISNRLDPRSFCEDVTLCTEDVTPTGAPPLPTLLVPLNTEQTVSCKECLFITELIMKMLRFNATEEKLAKLFQAACFALPSGLQTQCQSFLGEYAIMVIRQTMQEIDKPTGICNFLGFCPAGLKSVQEGGIWKVSGSQDGIGLDTSLRFKPLAQKEAVLN